MPVDYHFEPSRLEVWITSCVGHTILRNYYSEFIRSLKIQRRDHILDYGCGSGFISAKIATEVTHGKLTFVDVSRTWLAVTKHRLRSFNNTEGFQVSDFNRQISDEKFDKIIVHYTLHDFPKEYWKPILQQWIEHLHPDGKLILREPIGNKHGLSLFEIHNILDNTHGITLKYSLHTHRFLKDYVDIVCMFNSEHHKGSQDIHT